MNPSDALLARIAVGDTEAFDELYRRFQGRVFGLCLTLLRDRHQAEEVAQETFLQIWQRAARFDPDKGTANAWILRLAHSRSVDRVRHSQTSRLRDANHVANTHVAENDTVVESVLLNEEHSRVRAAMAELSPKQRESLTLAYFGGMTIRQISEHLAIPVPTVKTRMRDGLRRLSSAMTDSAMRRMTA